jgi:hypothetical protein
MRSLADAEPPEKRYSREYMLRLSTKMILLVVFDLPITGSP